jgi:hypothetical protein
MSISKVIAHQDKLKSKIAYADRMENCSLKSVMGAEEIVNRRIILCALWKMEQQQFAHCEK